MQPFSRTAMLVWFCTVFSCLFTVHKIIAFLLCFLLIRPHKRVGLLWGSTSLLLATHKSFVTITISKAKLNKKNQHIEHHFLGFGQEPLYLTMSFCLSVCLTKIGTGFAFACLQPKFVNSIYSTLNCHTPLNSTQILVGLIFLRNHNHKTEKGHNTMPLSQPTIYFFTWIF